MVVSRFSGRGAEYDDLFQVACMAFVKAVAGFLELSAGVQFSTYAVPVMLGEVRRYFRDNGALRVSRSIREQAHRLAALHESLSFSLGREPSVGELAEASGLEPESVAMALDSLAPVLSLSYAGEEGESPLFELLGDDPTQSMLDKAAVGSALDKLPERQKKLVLLRYYRSKTQQETARELGKLAGAGVAPGKKGHGRPARAAGITDLRPEGPPMGEAEGNLPSASPVAFPAAGRPARPVQRRDPAGEPGKKGRGCCFDCFLA